MADCFMRLAKLWTNPHIGNTLLLHLILINIPLLFSDTAESKRTSRNLGEAGSPEQSHLTVHNVQLLHLKDSPVSTDRFTQGTETSCDEASRESSPPGLPIVTDVTMETAQVEMYSRSPDVHPHHSMPKQDVQQTGLHHPLQYNCVETSQVETYPRSPDIHPHHSTPKQDVQQNGLHHPLQYNCVETSRVEAYSRSPDIHTHHSTPRLDAQPNGLHQSLQYNGTATHTTPLHAIPEKRGYVPPGMRPEFRSKSSPMLRGSRFSSEVSDTNTIKCSHVLLPWVELHPATIEDNHTFA